MTAKRFWPVAGVLLLIGIEALLFGYSYPFFSLALESKGIATWLIGLNASLAGAGILIFGPFLPALIDRLGLKFLVAAQFALSFLSFAAILAFDHLAVWFVARFVMGTCFSALWTTTEIWLNGVVDDRNRGRIVGASGTLYAACQFVGPLMLSATGSTGSLPLIAAMAPLAVGVAVALSIRSAVGETDEEETGSAATLRTALGLAGALIAAAFLTGVGETAMQSLLPLYGLAHGLSEAAASRLVAVFSLGEAILVAVLGWMADRYGRRLTLIGCAALAVVSTLALPFVMGRGLILEPVLFIAGGTVSGLYTLGIVLIGQDFRGQRLAVVSTGFAMAYSAGSVVGATPIGYLIDLFGVEALPLTVALGFLALMAFLVRPRRRIELAAED
ncbi:MFS transporter [Kaistia geumhonensis]|uniref:MFS family permease n=1 Tax=Kaistia geumhonensis TaxID=410839 RepID=A0ABU0M345_9HYPH|nr:MFS transporter [Kaistia geumhonensis]MCX5479435.1 MFS transporter [Kaistia geumhonensis]MDQ0515342.1 MFS family permease [Kaistia geumhonensis]